jgi:HAD superfamily hydrolase (TIGR01509 family)
MIKAAIFDMDGVLIDTVETGFRVRKSLLAQRGVNLEAIPDPQGEGHRAASLKDLLENVKEHSGIHMDHDEFAELARKHMREELQTQGISADPGLVTFLKDLKDHHITCAVASSSLRKSIDIKLDILGIRQYFSVIVTGSDVKEHKPHPATYLYALNQLRLASEDCIIFEDSLTGIAAGHATGCKIVGFTQYNPPKKPLQGVIATVSNWGEISYDRLERLVAE